jgi:phosphoenolpyruvate carboxylase
VLEAIAEKQSSLLQGYSVLSEEQKIEVLSGLTETADAALIENQVYADTLKVIASVHTIQKQNGQEGCNRYIISQCNSALNAMEVYGLFLLSGWKKEEMNIDIVQHQ